MVCGSTSKIWNLANQWKKWNKEYQTLSLQFLIYKSRILMLFCLFCHVVCKISNFNTWTTKSLYWVDLMIKKIIAKTFLAHDSPNLDQFLVVAQYILPMLVWLHFAGPYVFIREQYSRNCYVTQQDKKYELRVHE